MSYVPVRRGHGPLHIAQATGRGYRTACGKTMTGATLSVPLPRIDLGRRHREHYWSELWQHEMVCKTCDRTDPAP